MVDHQPASYHSAAEGGPLCVRGPNVMLGDLKADNPGVIEPPQDGWHDTGDIDAQRFVTIKGRASPRSAAR